MKYTTKQLNVYYAKVFLRCNDEDLSPAEYFASLKARFKSEYSHSNNLPEWLQGLPVSIPFYDSDIQAMLEETGYWTGSEKRKDDLVSGYWDFMACKLRFLWERKAKWFADNL